MPDLTTILTDALFSFHSWEPSTARSEAQAIVAAIPDAEREALAFGLAWLRVERALPEGFRVEGLECVGDEWAVYTEPADSTSHTGPNHAYATTPTAALTALAEALEARRG